MMSETRDQNRLPPPSVGQRMQRLRVGVTGLAAVILVVTLATAIASGVRRNAETITVTASLPSNASVNASDAKSEPLAQLGVAPGTKPETAR